MDENYDSLEKQYLTALDNWLSSCKRRDTISKNTVAVGLVVIDHLSKRCPVTREDVTSQGGEIKGSRAGLGRILEKYGVPQSYLKETTTRQAPQDGQRLFDVLDWGRKLSALNETERKKLLENLAHILTNVAFEHLRRENLILGFDRRQAPTTWIHEIVENAKSRSGGVVEQHLIGAKLEKRFKDVIVPNYPAHAADVQTSRDGDFSISQVIYHVTASPGRAVIQKCASNIRSGKFPILLVPSEKENHAKVIAEDEGIGQELTIISIENFVALNIIELSIEENKDTFTVLREIVSVYNRRLAEVETDLSLTIEVR